MGKRGTLHGCCDQELGQEIYQYTFSYHLACVHSHLACVHSYRLACVHSYHLACVLHRYLRLRLG